MIFYFVYVVVKFKSMGECKLDEEEKPDMEEIFIDSYFDRLGGF